MTYPKVYEKFGSFLFWVVLSIIGFIWLHGWWQIFAFVYAWVALDSGSEWLKELDKSRNMRRNA